MSKELTEKWRNGTLKNGYYYVTSFIGWSSEVKEIIHPFFLSNKAMGDIKEVVAPVPSYDEYNEFMQKIHILEKQLSSISEKLKEANDIIKKYRRFEVALKVEKGTLTGVYPAVDYLKKWDVK